MVYFILNIFVYMIFIVFYYLYLSLKKITILDFVLLVFNMNLYVIFILKDIHFFIGLLCSLVIILVKELCLSLFKVIKKDIKEIVLIKNGMIDFHSIVSNKIDFHKLVKDIKKRKIRIDEIEYCLKKDDDLIIVKNKDIKNYPLGLIVDGNILFNNLQVIKKDVSWLENELVLNNLTVNDIDYAYYKKNRLYFITN